MVKVISMHHLPAQVKSLFLQLYLNGLLIYIPDGICTNTIYSILGHLQFQVRSIYLFSWTYAMLDVVSKDFYNSATHQAEGSHSVQSIG